MITTRRTKNDDVLYGKDQTTIYPEQTSERNKKITNYIYKTILKEHYIIYIIVFLYIYPNMATKILINGQLQNAEGDARADVINPATGKACK